MSVSIGDTIPQATLKIMGQDGPENFDIQAFCADKKVVILAVPGAFTPTCSAAHLPGYVVNAEAIKEKGVDAIICTSVNDVFVMNAWGESQNANEDIIMAADGSADFAKALGLEMDLTKAGLGVRSNRYSMIVDQGKISHLNVEEAGKFEVSGAETILEQI